jgi:hypothetical protein
MTTTSSIPNLPTYHHSSLSDELQFFDAIMAEAGFFTDEDMMLPQPETEEIVLPPPVTIAETYKCISPPYSPNHPAAYSQPQMTLAGFGSSSPTSVHEMLNPHDLRYGVPQQQQQQQQQQQYMFYAPNQTPLFLPSAPSLIHSVETTPLNARKKEGTNKIIPKKASLTTTPRKRRLSFTSSSSGSATKQRNYTPKQQVDRR